MITVALRERVGRVTSLTLLALALLLLGAGAAVSWFVVSHRAEAAKEKSSDTLMAIAGLKQPVSNHLNPRFTDADGDLVADPPKDAKDFIDPPTLTFCYTPVDDPKPFKEAWADFTKHLSEMTGKPVEYLMITSDQEQLRALRDGKLHVAGLNTGRVPIAVDACGFVPVAMLAGDNDAGGRTHTEIIVSSSSQIKDVRGLKGHELTLTVAGSNSGFKAPLVFLKEFDLLPGRDYKIRYSGSHDQSIADIASGQFEAAAVAADVLQRAVAAGTIKAEQFRSIYKSENFPTAGLGYAYNLKPELAAKVREALLKYPWSGTSMEKYFGASGQHGVVPVNYKDDWSLVRRVDDATGYEHVVD
jgi:phosphonate transport system substrate-binding protein